MGFGQRVERKIDGIEMIALLLGLEVFLEYIDFYLTFFCELFKNLAWFPKWFILIISART